MVCHGMSWYVMEPPLELCEVHAVNDVAHHALSPRGSPQRSNCQTAPRLAASLLEGSLPDASAGGGPCAALSPARGVDDDGGDDARARELVKFTLHTDK